MKLIGITLVVAFILGITFVLMREAMQYGVVYAVGLLLVVSGFIGKMLIEKI